MSSCIKNGHGASSGRWSIWIHDKKITLRSGFEQLYAEHLMRSGIPFEYEPRYFKLGNGCRYLPDFYLPETDEYVEVKGALSEKAKMKIDLFPKVTGKRLLVLFEEDIKKIMPPNETLAAFYQKHRVALTEPLPQGA